MIAAEGPDERRLRTLRLVLEPVDAAHAAVLHPLVNDWEVVKMLSRVPWPITPEDVASFLAKRRAETGESAFTLLLEGAPIGVGGVKHPGSGEERRCMPSLGYWVGRRYWGCGYGTEAVAALTGIAFDLFPDANIIRAGVFGDNPASRRVLEKCGFAEAERYDTPSISRGGDVPAIDMRITRDAWLAARAADVATA